MTYLRKGSMTQVLLIEDRSDHAKQIREALSAANFECDWETAADDDRINTYIARHPSAQIMIVDLHLNQQQDADPYREGTKLIRERLWPYNRTMFFIVFSEHIKHFESIEFNVFEPHWCFVRKVKGTEGKPLSDDCLETLIALAQRCKEFSPAVLKLPALETANWVLALQVFGERQKKGAYQGAIERMQQSAAILHSLSEEAAQYAKVGAPALQIAVGVFGSCGRLEMRDDSDIEFSVYFEGGISKNPTIKLAVMLWNRMMSYMDLRGWKYEGREEIQDNVPKILLTRDAELASEFGERYMPLVSIDDLISSDPRKNGNLRNRHLQVLTQLRAVFNPECVYGLKRRLIDTHAGDVNSLSQLLTKPYFDDLFSQAFLDQRANPGDTSFRKAKSTVYRVFGLQTLQLGLIGCCLGANPLVQRLVTDDEWRSLFDFLTLSGLQKVMQLEGALRESFPELAMQVGDLADHYCDAWNEVTTTVDISDIKTLLLATADKFIEVTEKLSQHRSCNLLATKSRWLFDGGERYRSAIERL